MIKTGTSKILVVDDERLNVELFDGMLEGLHILKAYSGSEALLEVERMLTHHKRETQHKSCVRYEADLNIPFPHRTNLLISIYLYLSIFLMNSATSKGFAI